jgi:cyanophycinase
LARILNDFKPSVVRGIGIDRDQAVCFEETGKACVYSTFNKQAYFLAVHDISKPPEVFNNGIPITWNNNKKAIESYEIIGNQNGTLCFDIDQWKPLNESIFSYYYIIEGKLMNNINLF